MTTTIPRDDLTYPCTRCDADARYAESHATYTKYRCVACQTSICVPLTEDTA